MTDAEVFALVARLRWAQPGNPDTLALCAFAEDAVFLGQADVAPTGDDAKSVAPTHECAACARRRALKTAEIRRRRARQKVARAA